MKIMAYFGRFVASLEDDHNPLMGPVIWCLNLAGMTRSKKLISKCYIVQFYAIATFVTELIELFLLRSDLEKSLRNLSLSTLSLTCVLKSCTFVLWYKDWRTVLDYVSSLEREQIRRNEEITIKIMKEYTAYSRKIMYFYWCVTFCTVVAVMWAPLIICLIPTDYRERVANGNATYPEMLSSWVPYDKSRGYGYVSVFVIHALMLIYGGLSVASFDSNAVILMTFFFGQLRILKENCRRLLNDNIDHEQLRVKIAECHQHHMDLIKHSRIFDGVLSPVLFLYIIICSLMICASAIQMTKEGTTPMQQLSIAEYLGFLITQLFVFCWHSNEVYVMSETVRDGVYSSRWWSQGVRVRRSVLILSGQLDATVSFSAGPFTKLNISTFITILKGSYSYYTLLNKK